MFNPEKLPVTILEIHIPSCTAAQVPNISDQSPRHGLLCYAAHPRHSFFLAFERGEVSFLFPAELLLLAVV